MRTWLTAVVLLASTAISQAVLAAEPAPHPDSGWKVGKPIATYWAGPSLTDSVAQQMAEGSFNLVWCTEPELDVAQRHQLRGQLHDRLLSPATLDNPAQREQLADLIARVRHHPALYSYYITDEPSAADFPSLGQLVAHLHELDPQHLAYINLFPTYASNEQLGTTGDTIAAYEEHLRQYVQVVKPSLISYDHYQFAADGDTDQYFLNLAMIRQASQQANVPFLNIVQACSWTPVRRVPQGDEMRYLVYTTLAYGAQGISYYVYCHPGHTGGIALADGTPTPIYHALKTLNREFVATAEVLQPLRSLAVYPRRHDALRCIPLAGERAVSIRTRSGGSDLPTSGARSRSVARLLRRVRAAQSRDRRQPRLPERSGPAPRRTGTAGGVRSDGRELGFGKWSAAAASAGTRRWKTSASGQRFMKRITLLCAVSALLRLCGENLLPQRRCGAEIAQSG